MLSDRRTRVIISRHMRTENAGWKTFNRFNERCVYVLHVDRRRCRCRCSVKIYRAILLLLFKNLPLTANANAFVLYTMYVEQFLFRFEAFLPAYCTWPFNEIHQLHSYAFHSYNMLCGSCETRIARTTFDFMVVQVLQVSALSIEYYIYFSQPAQQFL